MGNSKFNKLIWLADTIHTYPDITFSEVDRLWQKGPGEGNPLPLRTFHHYRQAIEEVFDININCDKRSNTYHIADADGLFSSNFRMWLLNTFSLSNRLQHQASLKEKIVFENIPSGTQHIDKITEGIHRNRAIRMVYRAYNWENEREINIEPCFLKLFKQRWYLIGYNLEYQAFRSYALDRIQTVDVTEIPVISATDITPETYFEGCFGIVKNENLEPVRIVLRATASQAPYLRNLPLHPSQRETVTTGAYSDFELTLSPTFDFIQEILSKGSHITVMEPSSLVEEIRREVRKMNNLYTKEER